MRCSGCWRCEVRATCSHWEGQECGCSSRGLDCRKGGGAGSHMGCGRRPVSALRRAKEEAALAAAAEV